MIRSKLSSAAALLALPLASLVACESDGQNGDARPFATYHRSAPPGTAGEMHASALEGSLVLEAGCLYLQSEQRWLPVFPHDIHWDERTQTLQVPPWETTVQVGEQVGLTGGAVPYQPDVHTVPVDCEPPLASSGQLPEVWLVGMVGPPNT